METLEVTGRSVEEAIEIALEQLGAERDAHARTDRERAAAQASADARGAAAAGLGLVTAVSLIAHAARD